jgi:hypothetical protein
VQQQPRQPNGGTAQGGAAASLKEMVTVPFRPYPNPRRALRHLVRGHRMTCHSAGAGIVVHVYSGTTSKGIEAELRRLMRKEHSRGRGLG